MNTAVKTAASKSTAAKTAGAQTEVKAPVASAAAPAAPKVSAGDAAIALAQKAGCSNGKMLKAVWSTRGNIYAPVEGFEFGVAIIKSDLTKTLQALPADEVSPFILTPRPGKDGGADLSSAPAAKK